MRGLTWQLVCLVFLVTTGALISTVFSVLIATPKTPVRFQLGTYFGQSFYVVRYDQTTGRLVFDIPGNSNCYFLKQSWVERINSGLSSTLYMSMQLQLSAGLSLPTAKDYYLTRDSQLSLKEFAPNTSFVSSANDSRIFKSTCCCCGDYLAISTIYWGSRPYSVLTASASQTLALLSNATTTLCSSSGLLLYTYPSTTAVTGGTGGATGPSGSVGPSGPSGSVGPSGPSGSVGPSGPSGFVGPSGHQGPSGEAGGLATCPSGPIVMVTNSYAYTTPTATTYNSRSAGVAGTNGGAAGDRYQGVIGPLGESGSIGSSGAKGESGSSGSDGNSGATGSIGNSGATGSIGNSGATGSIGGDVCYARQKGQTGPTGLPGRDNPKGDQNFKGTSGASAMKGDSSLFDGTAGVVRPTVDLSSSVSTGKVSDNVQLVVDYGLERRYVVRVAGASARLAGFSRTCGDSNTVFQYQLYSTYAITPDGELVKVSSFTLRHLLTNTYLVADVSNTGELQAHSGMSGLSFMPQSEFAFAQAGQPDYRFFVQYAVRLPDGRTVRTFCSLFFRNYCMWPAATCQLSLRPVQTKYNLTTSTLADPDSAALLSFYDRARRVAHSVSIPAFSFNKVTVTYV